MDISQDFNALKINSGNNTSKSGKSKLYAVDSILQKRQEPNGSYSYKILWECDMSTSWEPEENINPYLISRYEMMNKYDYYNSVLSDTDTYVIGYARTSKGRDDNISIAVQEQEIFNICVQNNYTLHFIATENGKSARNMDNLTELKFILDYIKSCHSGGLKKVLMFYDVSRFSRNTAQALTILDDLKNNDIEVRFIKDNLSTINGHYQITIQLAAAQHLSDTTSARVRSAINFNRERGFHTGGVPKIGFRVVDRKLVQDEQEINIINKVYALYQEMKGLSKTLHQDICDKLNENNIRLRGKPFVVSKISLCLLRYNQLNF
jgi:DNA invertase Pin-like site-specific DNA recombinase